jgi:hypothetical protein
MMDQTGFVEFFLKHIWIPLLGVIGFLGKMVISKNKLIDGRLYDLESRQAFIENTVVKEDKVRQIIKETLIPYLEDSKEMKTTMSIINENVTQLRIEMATRQNREE